VSREIFTVSNQYSHVRLSLADLQPRCHWAVKAESARGANERSQLICNTARTLNFHLHRLDAP
jgi:hypothetical protein